MSGEKKLPDARTGDTTLLAERMTNEQLCQSIKEEISELKDQIIFLAGIRNGRVKDDDTSTKPFIGVAEDEADSRKDSAHVGDVLTFDSDQEDTEGGSLVGDNNDGGFNALRHEDRHENSKVSCYRCPGRCSKYCGEICRYQRVIQPRDNFYAVWPFILGVAVLFLCISVPLDLGFPRMKHNIFQPRWWDSTQSGTLVLCLTGGCQCDFVFRHLGVFSTCVLRQASPLDQR